MKIVITSQGKTLKDDLDPRFGRCQYFLIVDNETNEVEAIPNPQVSAGVEWNSNRSIYGGSRS